MRYPTISEKHTGGTKIIADLEKCFQEWISVKAARLQNETAPENIFNLTRKNGLKNAKKDPKKRSETRPKIVYPSQAD